MVSPWMDHGTVLDYLSDYGRGNVDKFVHLLQLDICLLLTYIFSCAKLHKACNIFMLRKLFMVTYVESEFIVHNLHID
jgi:hypothetical protein